ncbi:MAG TPA: NupC/NupG family nucleoside CNT transporter [Terriglobia bacterium]|jgi:CNT family concentrative nucleoside transporter|nr:NupC/NupG family nucleoside CNT transporter [Terriglobia bacterium]
MLTRAVPLLGILVILGFAFALSRNRRAVSLRIVGWGLGLQFLIAIFVLRTNVGYWLLDEASKGAVWLLDFSFQGSKFLFGPLGDPKGNLGLIFAFQVLPIIIYVACLSAILYYLRVLPLLVRLMGLAMSKIMRSSGAESLEVAASIMLGQTEAPLTIRPYLDDLTESELMTIMTAGMAHISGATLGAYILFGAEPRHLLTAVFMTAPGTIMIAKIFQPEVAVPKTAGKVDLELEKRDINLLDAASHGVTDGLFLALNVGAMLIAFYALIYLCNGIFTALHTQITLQSIFGHVLAPVAWVLGVPWQDALKVGNLMGTKMVLNEFVAFTQLGPLKDQITPRSFTIATYALCGFANFSSIGIQIGGIGSLAPSRKRDLARLGFRALLAGTLANYLSAAIAGLLLSS